MNNGKSQINENGTNGKSRQVQRKDLRDERKQQEQTRKYLNAAVPRREIIPFIQELQTLKDQQIKSLQERLAAMDLIVIALQKTLIKKGVVTEDELNEDIRYEQERTKVFLEVSQSKDSYEKRLDLCVKWDLPIESTGITAQIKQDSSLTPEQKNTLAGKYCIPRELVMADKPKSN